MERNNANQNEVNDDENDSSDVLPTARTGLQASAASAHLNLSCIARHPDILQFLQPSGSSLQLGANFAGLQSEGNGQQVGTNAFLPSAIAASRQIYQLQQLLSLQRTPLITPGQNPTATYTNFPIGAAFGQTLWPASALAQSTAARQLQYQQGNNLLASLSANRGNAVEFVPSSVSRAAPPGVGNLPSRTKISHGPRVMYMECDDESLSEYQCLLRKQIELFEA